MRHVSVVAGGHFGSEGKGNVVGWLAANIPGPVTVVRVAGPNAGHSAVGVNGIKYALRSLPIAAVTNPDCGLHIAPGSEIEWAVLEQEIENVEGDGIPVRERLTISPEATILVERHKDREASLAFGSTHKGIGAARADRIMRHAQRVIDACPPWAQSMVHEMDWVSLEGDVIVEGTQGYHLGLHAGQYPHCTSSDCRNVDFLAMAGIVPGMQLGRLETWLVFRTYPIRIAGNSGWLPNETTWGALGLDEEYTTVTKKVRRVGYWDDTLARAAYLGNGGLGASVRPVLMFADYWWPELAGRTTLDDPLPSDMWPRLDRIAEECFDGQGFVALGTSDRTIALTPALVAR